MGKSRKTDFIVFVLLLIFTIFGVIYSSVLFINSFEEGEEVSVSYNEESILDYKIWLLDNDFYSSEYLDDSYNVISSSIDEIEIDFDYLLEFSDFVQGVSYYTINSRIIAYQSGDSSKRKVWDYEKLIKDKVITTYNTDSLLVNSTDNFKINYSEYKKLMDDYKAKYGVSLVGNLIIEIEIKTDLLYENFKNNINMDKRVMTMTVPLTESVVNITTSEIVKNEQVLVEKEKSTINYIKLTLSVCSLFLGLYLCVHLGIILVRLLGIDSKFNKDLNKILRTYGSVIVNVDGINFDDNEGQMKVSSFDELLDAQQELKKPILYWKIKSNKGLSLAIFAIKNEKDMFVYRMSSILYENDLKKEISDKDVKKKV